MPAIGIELRDQLLVAEQAFDLLADRASSELIASYNEVTPHIPAGSQVDEVVTSNAYNIELELRCNERTTENFDEDLVLLEGRPTEGAPMPPRHYSVEMGEIDLENWVMVPHHVAPTVRRAMLMKGLAVYGTAAIYPLVERIVNKVDSKAVLRPLLVIPRPQIQFEDQKVNWVHIVILIQTSCGEAFIFDSTGEQHGVWKYHRFSTWNFYRYYYVMPQEYWSTGVTFACDDNFEGLRQQTLEESKLWADYMTLVDAVADEWFHTPGEVDLLERMKDHLGRDWARPPYDIPLEERAVRESTWIERAKPRGDTWIA